MHNLICTFLRIKSAVKEDFEYSSAKLQSSAIWWIANYQTSDLLGGRRNWEIIQSKQSKTNNLAKQRQITTKTTNNKSTFLP